MALKSYRPTTDSRRAMTSVNYRTILTTGKPLKSLVRGSKNRAGRNSQGRITMRHQGGGNKKNLRIVDFMFEKIGIPATVEHIEYDPSRSGFIARVVYRDGERRYILAPQKLAVGDAVIAAEDAPLTPGNRRPLSKIPVGTLVYNIEIKAK